MEDGPGIGHVLIEFEFQGFLNLKDTVGARQQETSTRNADPDIFSVYQLAFIQKIAGFIRTYKCFNCKPIENQKENVAPTGSDLLRGVVATVEVDDLAGSHPDSDRCCRTAPR